MNIGKAVQSQKIDDKKIEKIKLLLRNDDFLKEIINKVGNNILIDSLKNEKEKFFKNSSNKNRGHRNYQSFLGELGINALPDNKIFNAFLRSFPNNLGKGNHREKFCLCFYQDCMTSYFINHEKELQELLLKVEVDDKELNSNEILDVIKSNRLKYNVSSETIERLFKYWWFDELSVKENFNPSVSQSVDDLIDEINKIKIELINIKAVQTSPIAMEGFKQDIEIVKNKMFLDIQNDISDLGNNIQKLRKELSGTQLSVKENSDKIDKAGEKINLVKSEVNILSAKLKKTDSDLKSIIEEKERKSLKLLKDNVAFSEEKVLKRIDDEIKIINTRLLETIGDSQRTFLDINGKISIFPSVGIERKPVLQEEIFLNAWKNYLAVKYGKNHTIDEIAIYHALFKSQSYIILQDEVLAKSWVETIGLENRTAVEAASPLWVSKLDWLGLAVHLETEAKINPIGLITNFNVGVTEAYLIPIIAKWNEIGLSGRQKLFLISDVSSKDNISFEGLYDYVARIPRNDVNESASSIKNLSNKDLLNVSRNLPQIKVETYRSWIQSDKVSIENFRNVVVKVPGDRWGIKLREISFVNFVSMYANLMPYFNSKDSLRLSVDACLAGIIESNYGHEMLDNYTEYLLEFF